MSSSNRERRQRNRAVRSAAAEEALRRARRQRITFSIVGLAIALVVGIALVARATSGNGSSAASTTTTSTSAASTTTTVPAPKRCVAMHKPLPSNTPLVPVAVGKAPAKLVKRDLQVGTGAVVKPGDTVTVNYVGVLCSTGKVFGSTYGSAPQSLALNGTIQGWQQGIPGMRVGGERLLGIPSALGYGPEGTPDGAVGPDEPLWYVVQVVKDS